MSMLIVLASLGLIQRHCPIDTETVPIPVLARFNSSIGHRLVPIPVLALPRWCLFPVWALAKCPYQYWHCRDGVHFQYGHLPSARTSIGIAAMAFFSSMDTCQVPIPVLARSITNDGKYSLPILMNSIVLWKNADKKVNTS